jgi:REP element-mobilizing transposase RayT
MAVYTPATKKGIYFITFTCYRWLHLLELTNSYDAVYKWFDYLTQKGHSVTGYVIMPNHLHLLLHYAGGTTSLNLLVGNAKRFLAYEIVKRLGQGGHHHLLLQLKQAVEYKDQQRGKLHEVWEDSFDWKQCRTEKFILQKLGYMHDNPCSGRWQLAYSPMHYPHSSASFYHNGKHISYRVKDYREVLSCDEEE